MKAKIISINISKKKGTAKDPVPKAKFIVDFGIEGDAHAGPGDRQVSLLAIESYEKFKKERGDEHCLKHGAFGENIITRGVELHKLPLGTKVKSGTVLLELSKIGKECHMPCAIGKKAGKCIMPTEGIFARVLKGGTLHVGDEIHAEKI